MLKPGDRVVIILPDPVIWDKKTGGKLTWVDDEGYVGRMGVILQTGGTPSDIHVFKAYGSVACTVRLDDSDKNEVFIEPGLRKIEPPEEEQLGSWSEILNITRWRPQILHA